MLCSQSTAALSRCRPFIYGKRLLTALAAVLSLTNAYAQTTPFEEASKAIKAPHAVAQLGPELFGDKVNLYNGSLEFSQTDFSVPGNDKLPMAVSRRLVAGRSTNGGKAFGLWDLEIPYLHGVFATNSVTGGWNARGSTARCSQFDHPRAVTPARSPTFDAEDFWQGNFLHIPGQSDQMLLLRDSANTATPSPHTSYPVVTSRQWAFSCLASLANGTGAGEGFLARSPDGTQYRFDHMVSYFAETVEKSANGATGWLPRQELRLLPTLITDRYGNTLAFSYNPARPTNLMSITASDGRTLTFTYGASANPFLITAATDGDRTWTYSYLTSGNANLDKVTLPDGSSWTLGGISPLLTSGLQFAVMPGCDDAAVPQPYTFTGSMTHPSGATGTFTMVPTTHGRSRVPEQCILDSEGGNTLYATIPRYFYTNSLTQKTINGPGLPAMSWHYDYGPVNASWSSCTTCASTKTVTVTDPAFVTRYIFGNDYHGMEGKLLQVDAGWDGSSAVRTTKTHYRPAGRAMNIPTS